MTISDKAIIHPMAVVEEGAILHDHVKIGPFCVVGPNVELFDGVELISNATVVGHTRIGAGTKVYPHASLGSAPQDLKYAGEPSRLEVGENNTIREYVTMNLGTETGAMVTTVGNNGLYMIGVHIGHDCVIGDNVIIANNVGIAGHVEVGDRVVIGAMAGIHQWVRIGSGAMIGGLSPVVADVIPNGMVIGERASLEGLNLVGLKRAGLERSDINGLRAAFKELFQSEGTVKDHLDAVKATYGDNPLVAQIVEFIEADSSRSLHVPKGK